MNLCGGVQLVRCGHLGICAQETLSIRAEGDTRTHWLAKFVYRAAWTVLPFSMPNLAALRSDVYLSLQQTRIGLRLCKTARIHFETNCGFLRSSENFHGEVLEQILPTCPLCKLPSTFHQSTCIRRNQASDFAQAVVAASQKTRLPPASKVQALRTVDRCRDGRPPSPLVSAVLGVHRQSLPRFFCDFAIRPARCAGCDRRKRRVLRLLGSMVMPAGLPMLASALRHLHR